MASRVNLDGFSATDTRPQTLGDISEYIEACHDAMHEQQQQQQQQQQHLHSSLDMMSRA